MVDSFQGNYITAGVLLSVGWAGRALTSNYKSMKVAPQIVTLFFYSMFL